MLQSELLPNEKICSFMKQLKDQTVQHLQSAVRGPAEAVQMCCCPTFSQNERAADFQNEITENI